MSGTRPSSTSMTFALLSSALFFMIGRYFLSAVTTIPLEGIIPDNVHATSSSVGPITSIWSDLTFVITEIVGLTYLLSASMFLGLTDMHSKTMASAPPFATISVMILGCSLRFGNSW